MEAEPQFLQAKKWIPPETPVTQKAGDVQWAIAQLSNGKAGPCIRSGGPADKNKFGGAVAEQWKAVVGQRAQAPLSARAQVIAATWTETAATGRVPQEDKDAEIAFSPKPGKDTGDAKNWSAAQPYWQGLGNIISSSTCASRWKGYRPMPILGRSLEEAREMQQPSLKTCSRDSPTRTTKQAAAALSLQFFFVRHHPEGSTVGSGLRCREVERTVRGTGSRSRRHRATLFETASEGLLPKSTSRWEYDREALTARGVSFFCMPSAARMPRKKTSASQSHCGGSTWEHIEQIGPV